MFYVWKTVMLDGNFTYEFALFPFDGRWNNARLHQEALNYNFPVIISSSKKGNGLLDNQYQPIDMKSGNIILSALYTDGGKPYIRFYESQGTKDALELKYRSEPIRFIEVNLSGNEQGLGHSPFFFLPWQIKTFRLDAAGF